MAMELPADGAAPADSTTRTLVVVCSAHWLSHYYLLVLPPLLPFLKESLGVSYLQLGIALTLSGTMSALTQAPVGSLCDRYGARKILTGGVVMGSIAFVLLGLHLSYPAFLGSSFNYPMLLIAGCMIGLGNSVYHPGDYALLSANVDESKIGRAFSIHTSAGFVGSAMAPPIMIGLTAAFGVPGALAATGIIGVVVAAILILFPIPEATAETTGGSKASSTSLAGILTMPILMLTATYILMRLSNGGVESFSIAALMNGYSFDFNTANVALTGYFILMSIGVLAGGYLADNTDKHGQLAAICVGIAAFFVTLIATMNLPTLWVIVAMGCAGFFNGFMMPSRDMLVRKAAPPGTAGRAFGIVSTGFSIGGMIGPLIYGFVLDQNAPLWVFGIAAGLMLVTMTMMLLTERRLITGTAALSEKTG